MSSRLGKWTRIVVLGVFVGVPLGFVVQFVYRKLTALPKEITITGGQRGARFSELANRLAEEIHKKLGVKVRIIPTAGSLENLVLLRDEKADFGLYQSGTLQIMERLRPSFPNRAGLTSLETVAFVANLESQPAHFVVRRDAHIESPADLRGKTVSLGLERSGSYAVSLALLKHFGLDETSIRVNHLPLEKVKEGFLDGSLDAALITSGVHSPIFVELFETGKCFLLSIPNAEALAAKHVGLVQYKIPAGIYRTRGQAQPATDVQTIALHVQLLARNKLTPRLVEQVTGVVLSEHFLKQNDLGELFTQGHRFAREAPDFSMHPGARHFYDPELRPFLPPDFVAALEHLRSFIFSIALSLYLAYRWFQRRKEHKLVKYIKELLAIEQEARRVAAEGTQIVVDGQRLRTPEETLLELLERIDRLKHGTLQSFTVDEINEELAISCFVQMCDSLADKINATISRLKLHKRFDELPVLSSGEK